MQTPKEHEMELEIRREKQMQELAKEREQKRKDLEKEINSKAGSIGKRVVGLIIFTIIFLNVAILFFGILLVEKEEPAEGFVTMLLIFFLPPLIVSFIFMLVNLAKLVKRSKIIKQFDGRKEQIEKEYRDKVNQLDAQIRQWNKNYEHTYKNKITDATVSFANSKLAQEIIDLLSVEFSRHIDALDRTSNIHFLMFTYTFRVYYNMVKSCYTINYDFDINRCRNLSSLVEQEALAKALATQVQINIMMKYNENQGEAPVRIDISYEYPQDGSVEVKLDFTAVNSNYEQVRNW